MQLSGYIDYEKLPLKLSRIESQAEKIDHLLEKCHDAILSGLHTDAEAMARQALEMNRQLFLAHPLAIKMECLSEILPVPAALTEGKEERDLQRAVEARRALLQTQMERDRRLIARFGHFGYYQEEEDCTEFIDFLMEECHSAYRAGHRQEAELLLRQARFHAPHEIADHPRLARMHPLLDILNEPEQLWPPCDQGIPPPDGLFLQIAHQPFTVESAETSPPESIVSSGVKTEELPTVLELEEEACELEIVPVQPERPRFQVQIGPWHLKLTGEGEGKRSMELSLSILGTGKEKK
jgi:hypothetical protein